MASCFIKNFICCKLAVYKRNLQEVGKKRQKCRTEKRVEEERRMSEGEGGKICKLKNEDTDMQRQCRDVK